MTSAWAEYLRRLPVPDRLVMLADLRLFLAKRGARVTLVGRETR